MIPYEVDPSLHPAEPAPPTLADGFAPPRPVDAADPPVVPHAADGEPDVEELAAALGDKSAF